MDTHRIVLYGPPLAGKQSLLSAYARAHSLKLDRFQVSCGTSGFPHWVTRLNIPGAETEFLTIPGSVWEMDAWWSFLEHAAGVGLVLDSQEARENADREHIAALLNQVVPAVRCAIFTKEDLVALGAVERVSRALVDDPRIASWMRFGSRHDQQESLTKPLEWLLSQVATASARPYRTSEPT